MFVNFHMYLVFAIFAHEIICRTIDSKTVPTEINVSNQSKPENRLPNTTESATVIPMPTSTASNSLDICEYFDSSDEPNFRFNEHGVTVIMRLF